MTKFPVEILIGADSYWCIVGDENIHDKCTRAINSFIGYFVSGPLQDTHSTSQRSSLHISAVQLDDITRLWSLEALGILPDVENTDSAAAYQSDCITYQGNQYTAWLKWNAEQPERPYKYVICQQLTRYTDKSFLKKPQLLQLYSKIIRL
jgi:hypothetical protein